MKNVTKKIYLEVQAGLRETGIAKAQHTVGLTFIIPETMRFTGPTVKDSLLFWKHWNTWVFVLNKLWQLGESDNPMGPDRQPLMHYFLELP